MIMQARIWRLNITNLYQLAGIFLRGVLGEYKVCITADIMGRERQQ